MARWDVTLSKRFVPNRIELHNFLKELASKAAYQEEKGDDGFEHYQIKLILIKKRRGTDLIGVIKNTFLINGKWTPTVDANIAFNYSMKLDTRVEGPWMIGDVGEEVKDEPPEHKDRALYEWQQSVVESCRGEPDDRTVNVIVSEHGNIGGSWLAKWLRWNQVATVIPAFTKAEDMTAMVMCKPPSKAYFIDMPRGLKGKALGEYWTGVEHVKNGYVWDKRHTFKDRQMASPTLWIKTNTVPSFQSLSPDRWQIWVIGQKMELVEYTEHRFKVTEALRLKGREKEYKAPEHSYLDDLE